MTDKTHDRLETGLSTFNRNRVLRGLAPYEHPPGLFEVTALVLLLLTIALVTLFSP